MTADEVAFSWQGGEPTFDAVFAAAQSLRRFKVPVNTLTRVHGEFCGKGVAVEHDGSADSCDHFVYPKYRLGKIRDKLLADMVFSREQVKFGYAKSESLPVYGRQCEFLGDCWGECPKNRLLRTPDGEPGLNYLRPGFQRFFAHAVPTAKRLATRFQATAQSG